MLRKLNILIEKDEDGYYAYCPELPGCQTQGDSLEEVRENMKEAVEVYLETLSEEEKTAIFLRFVTGVYCIDWLLSNNGFLSFFYDRKKHLSFVIARRSEKPVKTFASCLLPFALKRDCHGGA
jgi:predicted RNase H-like HicB family nuclease